MSKKIDVPLILLAIAGFLAPLIGGQVAVDALALPSGTDPWVNALLGGAETPTLSHAILALLCAASLVVMLLQRKILQVPNSTVGGLLMVLLALILSTVGYSSFKGVSLPAAVEWLSYGVTFYAVVAAAGRQRGPTVLLGAIFAGCVVLALLGIREFGDMKAIAPNWRIYPQWVGPNAIAAILVVGLFLGLGLAINSERAIGLAIACGCVAIGLALFLTQSKGALGAFLVCLVVYVFLLIVWIPRRQLGRALGFIGGTLGVVLLLAVAMSLQSKASAPTAGGSPTVASPAERFINVSASSDQSVGFRKLLWQSALSLMKRNPLGSGIGTFQYESTRPGLTTQTHFAHETYLQLGAEASAAAPLLLVAMLVFWARLLFRGGSKLQADQNVLRASVLAAVGAVAAHSLIDSDFSYYGVGIVVFMLLGVGLLLSSDAVAPEFLPTMLRRIAAAGISALILFLVYIGMAEGGKAQVRYFIDTRSLNDAQNRLESLRTQAPWDAEVQYMSSEVAQSAPEMLGYAKHAIDLGPSTRNFRWLARIEAREGMNGEAIGALERANQLDPNNLQTLSLLAEIQASIGEEENSKQTLKKLIDVEKTSYFQVKSETELVATETYEARIQLASKSTDNKEKVDLLQPAVDGFKQYLALTVPNVIKMAQNKPMPLRYAGESMESAQKKMADAGAAAKTLAEAYRALGDPVKAAAADADAVEFAKPLDLPSAK